MESGLFGIPELHTGRGYGTTPDYFHRCLTPVRLRELQDMPDSNRQSRQQGKGATANELGNNHARVLVDALSNPELIQILSKWHIRDPRGMPYSKGVPRNQLLDLVVQHDEALAEIVRLVTPAKGARGVISPNGDPTQKLKAIRIRSDRAASAGYRSILNDYMKIHNAPSTMTELQAPPRRRSESVPLLDRRPESGISHDLIRTARKDSDVPSVDLQHVQEKRRKPDDKHADDSKSSSLRDARRKYHKLKRLLSETRREKEEAAMQLAKRGLLAFALEKGL